MIKNFLIAITLIIITTNVSLAKTAEEYFNDGIIADEKGNYQTAIESYTRSIQVYPTAEAYYNRALTKGELGKPEESIDDYTQAININPFYFEAYLNRAAMKYNAYLDCKGALEDLDKAISIEPNYADAYYNRGNAKSGLSDYKGALEDFEKARDLYLKNNDTEKSNQIGQYIVVLKYFLENPDFSQPPF